MNCVPISESTSFWYTYTSEDVHHGFRDALCLNTFEGNCFRIASTVIYQGKYIPVASVCHWNNWTDKVDCYTFKRSINRLEYLGHSIGEGILTPNEGKLQAIRDAPRPETKKQVRSFLGLIGFYRKFVPNFAAIAVPLTDLTKKGVPNRFEWKSEHENAFQSLKSMLLYSPILRLPDLSKPFIIRTDASDYGVGAVLLQEHDGKKFPVAYASKKLSTHERGYSVIERECFGYCMGVGEVPSVSLWKRVCG